MVTSFSKRSLAVALVASLAAFGGLLSGTASAQVCDPALLSVELDQPDFLELECMSPDGAARSMMGTVEPVECNDPNLAFSWMVDGVLLVGETGPSLTLDFPLGETTVTLTATYTDPVTMVETIVSDTIVVLVLDRTAPILIVEADRACLWPPNHKMHEINVAYTAEDVCDPEPLVLLEDVTSNEPDNGLGDGNTVGDIGEAEIGTEDLALRLRAERQGMGSGRVYELIYSATDLSGNQAVSSLLVTVPHDMGKGSGDCKRLNIKKANKGNKGDKDADKAANKAAKEAEKAAKKAAKEAAKAAKKGN